jgi:hypothetical protein
MWTAGNNWPGSGSGSSRAWATGEVSLAPAGFLRRRPEAHPGVTLQFLGPVQHGGHVAQIDRPVGEQVDDQVLQFARVGDERPGIHQHLPVLLIERAGAHFHVAGLQRPGDLQRRRVPSGQTHRIQLDADPPLPAAGHPDAVGVADGLQFVLQFGRHPVQVEIVVQIRTTGPQRDVDDRHVVHLDRLDDPRARPPEGSGPRWIGSCCTT